MLILKRCFKCCKRGNLRASHEWDVGSISGRIATSGTTSLGLAAGFWIAVSDPSELSRYLPTSSMTDALASEPTLPSSDCSENRVMKNCSRNIISVEQPCGEIRQKT